jgi:hydroxyacylglutathione hydrolase
MNLHHEDPAPETIAVIPCGDNFIYLCRYDEQNAFAVDPSEAGAVSRALAQQNLTLTSVLVTHHHGDHTGGIARLKKQTGCQIIGPDRARISGCDQCAGDGDTLTFGSRRVMVLATPGHTQTSVCYHLEPTSDQRGCVWTGDTLFVGGCGRPMECDAAILWQSLARLAELPDDTLVYCGHDYTAENYEFALTIDPESQATQQRWEEAKQAPAEGRPTVPSTIAQEKATNIFLRSTDPTVKNALGMSDAPPASVFAELRRRKNLFG